MYGPPSSHRPGARRGQKVTVVGAGPVGCYAAGLLARAGYRVCIVEEHAAIGVPAHCTGIVTRDLLDIMEVPARVVTNVIGRVRLTAPDGTRALARSSDVVLDRVAFDAHLASQAREAGAEILLSHRFVGFGRPGAIRIAAHSGEAEIATDVLIGADGPTSLVARRAGMYGRRRFYAGAQLRAAGRFESDLYEVHLVVPQFFGWVVPESPTIARVGIAARRAPRLELASLVAGLEVDLTPLDRQWGLIPIYDPSVPVSRTVNGIDVRLVGDAATMVKATTGGGLVPGLLAARALHDSLASGKSYARLLGPLRRRLRTHLGIRRALNTFADADYGRLVRTCAGERVAEVLATDSRDRPFRLLWNLLRADPRLAAFAGVVIGRWFGSRALEGREAPALAELAAEEG